jgi:hypothetical protein
VHPLVFHDARIRSDRYILGNGGEVRPRMTCACRQIWFARELVRQRAGARHLLRVLLGCARQRWIPLQGREAVLRPIRIRGL